MPFIGTIIINGGGGGGIPGWPPDVNPLDGIVDDANRITMGGVTVVPQEVKDAEADIVDLELNKMNKTDPVDGGNF